LKLHYAEQSMRSPSPVSIGVAVDDILTQVALVLLFTCIYLFVATVAAGIVINSTVACDDVGFGSLLVSCS